MDITEKKEIFKQAIREKRQLRVIDNDEDFIVEPYILRGNGFNRYISKVWHFQGKEWVTIWIDFFNYELLDTIFEKKEDYNDNPFSEKVSYSFKGTIYNEDYPFLISEID